jgi:hypothetical protein
MDTIKLAWSKVYGAKGSIWAGFGILFVIMFCLGIIDGIFQYAMPNIEPGIAFIVQVIGFLLQMGMVYLGIRRAQDLPINYRMMFRTFESSITIRIIGLYLLQVIILIIPMVLIFAGIFINAADTSTGTLAISILLFIIGILAVIILGVRMMLSMGYVLDKGAGPIEALKLSFAASKANFWRIVGITLLETLIIIISAIPLGIGLIWTLPFGLLVYGVMYNTLSINNLRSQ